MAQQLNLYWNISLDEGGFSRWGWQQNSLVTVNPAEKTYKFNHEYYLLKHVSHFVKPGAKRLITDGAFQNILAFINPDKSIACIVQNDESVDKEVKIEINGNTIKPVLQANSFNTFLVKAD